MKRYVKSEAADVSPTLGTTYYRITVGMLADVFSEGNIWIQKAIAERGIDAIDVDQLIGSQAYTDALYLCVTDGHEIEVDGEMMSGEDLLEQFSPNAPIVQPWIQDASRDIVEEYITPWVFHTPFFDDWGPDVVAEHGFISAMEAAQEEHWFNEM